MPNFSHRKIPVFPNINDNPRIPTADKAGNGSDVVARFNGLIEDLNSTSFGGEVPVLTQDTTWYVDAVNGIDTNNGLTKETAFKTIKKASEVASAYQNPNLKKRIINLLPGTHEGAKLAPFTSRNNDNDYIEIRSDAATKGDVIIGDQEGIEIIAPSTYYFDNLTINGARNTGNGVTIVSGRVEFGSVAFGRAVYHQVYAVQHSTVAFWSNYEINEGGKSHIYADAYSFVDISYPDSITRRTITILNNPNFDYFVDIKRGSYLSAYNLTINGSVSGTKYRVTGRSVIDTGTGNVDLLPGTSGGQLIEGSLYL